MAGALLSRVCGRALVDFIEQLAIEFGELERLRLRFVRSKREQGLGSYILHVVPAKEGADGVRVAARQCLCGQVEGADIDER
jgi:hypothetical protein